MKKLLTLGLALVATHSFAQCYNEPPCENNVNTCGGFTSTNYTGNYCFYGHGDIPSSMNWNNWTFLKFESDGGSIDIFQNINFGNGATQIYCKGYTIDFFCPTISMNGGDTLFVAENTTVTIGYGLVSNNSTAGQYNTIVMAPNSHVYRGYGNTVYNPGDTIKGGSTNPSNWIYVIGCPQANVPLQVGIIKWVQTGNKISWEVNKEYATIEHYENGNWAFYQRVPNEGYFTPTQGEYRLVCGTEYSKIIQITASAPNQYEQKYDLVGRKIDVVTQPLYIQGNKIKQR